MEVILFLKGLLPSIRHTVFRQLRVTFHLMHVCFALIMMLCATLVPLNHVKLTGIEAARAVLCHSYILSK